MEKNYNIAAVFLLKLLSQCYGKATFMTSLPVSRNQSVADVLP